MRWVVRLTEFDLDIQHRKGRKSGNVDGITRTPPPANDTYGATHIESLYDIKEKEREKEDTVMSEWCLGARAHTFSEGVHVVTRSKRKATSEPKLGMEERSRGKKRKDARESEEPESKIEEKTEEDREEKEEKSEEPEERKDEIEIELSEEEAERKHDARPFFKCEREIDITSMRDIQEAQADEKSKCMEYVRGHIDRWHNKTFYTIQSGVYIAKREGDEWGRIIAPERLRAHILRSFHNSALSAHQGEKRTFLQIREHFFWPGMKHEILRWVKACLACRKRKTPRPMRAGITEATQAQFPNGTVAIDILGPFPLSEGGNTWVLTMIDTFTRWPVATPIKDRSSATIATAIYKHWICERSVPIKIISDRAREFVSRGVKQLAARLGTVLLTTSGYNPTGNSSIERFHRYLNASLSIVYEKIKADWDDYIPAVLFSYRSSMNETTGHSPFFLEHGREAQTPMGNMFTFLRRKAEPRETYVEDITDKLNFAFERARNLQVIAAERNKAQKPEQFQPKFEPGDLLLQERSAKEGRGTRREGWSQSQKSSETRLQDPIE